MAHDLTNRIQSLPLDYIAREELSDEYGMYLNDRIKIPIQPAVVRQNSPDVR